MSKPRLIAVILLLLASPIQLMTMPWLVFTIYEFKGLISELSRDGSSAYIEGRSNRLQRNVFKLSLYVLNCIAMVGLFGITINIFRNKIILFSIWFIVILLGSGYLIFIPSTEGDFEKNTFVAFFILLPIFLALVGAYVTCRSRDDNCGASL